MLRTSYQHPLPAPGNRQAQISIPLQKEGNGACPVSRQPDTDVLSSQVAAVDSRHPFLREMMATSTAMTCSLYTLKQAGRVRRAAPQPDELRVGLRYR